MSKTNTDSIKLFALAAMLTFTASLVGCTAGAQNRWQDKLAEQLPVLGHRNWLLITDSAYPAQVSPGIETIATGADQVETVRTVLNAVDKAQHVRAKVYLDDELKYVSQDDAPGINAYRRRLDSLLTGRQTTYLAHEDLIAKLDEAAKTFKVLVLKTDMTLPYTSVFLELDCGYWNARAEHRLRRTIEQTTAKPAP